MNDIIYAPFTPEQVEALNKYQLDGRYHPYTCGSGKHPDQQEILIADTLGWYCPLCDYKQTWAHRFSTKE